jgi:hypothetical protein
MALPNRYDPSHVPGETTRYCLDYSNIIPMGVGIIAAGLSIVTNTNPVQAQEDWNLITADTSVPGSIWGNGGTPGFPGVPGIPGTAAILWETALWDAGAWDTAGSPGQPQIPGTPGAPGTSGTALWDANVWDSIGIPGAISGSTWTVTNPAIWDQSYWDGARWGDGEDTGIEIIGRRVYALLSGGREGVDYQFRWIALDTMGNIFPRTTLVLCSQAG